MVDRLPGRFARLVPWTALLGPLAPNLLEALGPWLRRLEVSTAPPSERGSGDGEVEGYSGVTRSGPFDRLLISGLGVLHVAPEEFLRRAVEGELDYLELEHRQRGTRRDQILLFDVGPTQLGAPRAAQLALLLVLARRAGAVGVRVALGFLQRPASGLEGLSLPESIRRYLEARCWEPVSAQHLEQWRQALGADESPVDDRDIWVIGARGGSLDGATTVEIAQGEPGGGLDVVLRGAGQTRRLELPPLADEALARVFEPWWEEALPAPAVEARARLELNAGAAVVFSPDGGQLLIAEPDGVVRSLVVKGEAPTGRSLRLEVQGYHHRGRWHRKQRVAVGLEPGFVSVHVSDRGLEVQHALELDGGDQVVLRCDPHRHQLYGQSGQNPQTTHSDLEVAGLQPAFWLSPREPSPDLPPAYVFLDRGRLWAMQPSRADDGRHGVPFCVAKRVLAVVRSGRDRLHLVTRRPSGRTSLERFELDSPAKSKGIATLGRTTGAVFLHQPVLGPPLVAAQREDGDWFLWK